MKNAIALAMVCAALAACGGGSKGGAKAPETAAPSPSQPATPEPITSGATTAFIPAAIADVAPLGATYSFTLAKAGTPVQTITNAAGEVSFNPVPFGDYEILATASLNGTQIAQGSTAVKIDSAKQRAQAALIYSHGSLLAEPVLEPLTPTQQTIGGNYDGQARMYGCIKNDFTDFQGQTSTRAKITVLNNVAKIELDLFPKPKIIIEAELGKTDTAITASGTFKSSDFTEGSVKIDKIVVLENESIYLSMTLKSTCETQLDYAGFSVGVGPF